MQKEPCILCGEPNSQDVAYCKRCNYRLPWANELEGTEPVQIKKSLVESKLDEHLQQHGLYPKHTLACRFCNQPIETYAKQCPHCKRWLISHMSDAEVDPWEVGYDKRAVEKVDMIQPRGGCLSVMLFLLIIPGVLWLTK